MFEAEDTCLMLTFEFHFKSSLLSTPFHTFLFLTTNFTLALIKGCSQIIEIGTFING